MAQIGDTDMNVLVKNTCIGCGSCAAISSKNFEMDDEGATPNPDIFTITEELEDARVACPVQAIEFRRLNCIKRGLTKERVVSAAQEAQKKFLAIQNGELKLHNGELIGTIEKRCEDTIDEASDLIKNYRLRK